MNLEELTIHEAHELLVKRQVSSVELTRATLDHIAAVDGGIKAYITVTADDSLKAAEQADDRLRRSDAVTPLTGVPVAIKDNMCTAGVTTTCASRMLERFVPPHDATAVSRLKAAGAVIVGKANLDEFAMGSSTENSAFFPTRNPRDVSRVPGGSSGGSAAAVASGQAVCALGSDTGGSVRLPASFCGLVGLKPTYGRVSRYGLVAFASSLDQIGPLTKDVRDCALVMNAIAGSDYLDATSVAAPVPDYTAALIPEVRGLRVGVAAEYFVSSMQPEVEKAVKGAVAKFEELGASVVEVSLPHTRFAVASYYIIAPAEASANLARYDGVKYGLSVRSGRDIWDMYFRTREAGFGPEVKRRIMLGTYALSTGYYDAYYLKAQKVRTLIKQDFDRAFETCDVLLTPTAPSVAFPLGERVSDPLAMYQTDVCTLTVNQAGIPGMSIPCGWTNGLPIGLQILGRPFDEPTILRVAYAYEQATAGQKDN